MAAGGRALLPAGDEVGVGGRDRGGAWRDLEGEEREREEEERGEISVGGWKGRRKKRLSASRRRCYGAGSREICRL